MLATLAAVLLAVPQAQSCGYDRAGHRIAMGQVTPDAQMSAKPAWFASGKISLGPNTYAKSQTILPMSAFELAAYRAVDEKGGVPVFMEEVDGKLDLAAAYVLVNSAECQFQRFDKQ